VKPPGVDKEWRKSGKGISDRREANADECKSDNVFPRAVFLKIFVKIP
jgi:hypothetical protein